MKRSSKEVSNCEDSLEPIQIDAENRLNEYKTNLLKFRYLATSLKEYSIAYKEGTLEELLKKEGFYEKNELKLAFKCVEDNVSPRVRKRVKKQ